MIRLHYYPGNASMAPHILLHELGVPFELVLVDRAQDAQRSAAYLRLNPNGTIPVLEDGTLVLYETAAILLHLVDTHPGAGFAPALASSERAHFYKWLIWLSNTLQATLMVWVYPERWVAEPNAVAVELVKRQAQLRLGGLLDRLEAQLEAHAGEWLLGEAFTAIDPLAWMLCVWTRKFDPSISPPAHARRALGEYMKRMLDRPSVQRVLADEQLAQRKA